MLACNETITLVQHTADNDRDTYNCIAVAGASWYAKTVIVTSGDGAKPANSYEVRIFGELAAAPKPGDYVVRGTIESVTKPTDLKGHEYFRITSVGDNRRGGLRHWRVSGQ